MLHLGKEDCRVENNSSHTKLFKRFCESAKAGNLQASFFPIKQLEQVEIILMFGSAFLNIDAY